MPPLCDWLEMDAPDVHAERRAVLRREMSRVSQGTPRVSDRAPYSALSSWQPPVRTIRECLNTAPA